MTDYEKDLDAQLERINTDGGMPVDAYQIVLAEFNARMLAKILKRLDSIDKKLKKTDDK